ncbi:MAG: secondary thiamine-phosphate synthase enzyme YjbQ [Acuticoccus sp.]
MRVETVAETAATRLVRGRLTVPTHGEGFADLSRPLHDWLAAIAPGEGMLSAFVRHTTASLVIQENADPDVRADLLTALARLAPRRGDYRHALEGPDDMPAHIKAVLCGANVEMPVSGGLLTGTWQSLYLLEHRAGHRNRDVILTYVGS